jgi:hypothetical protein
MVGPDNSKSTVRSHTHASPPAPAGRLTDPTSCGCRPPVRPNAATGRRVLQSAQGVPKG